MEPMPGKYARVFNCCWPTWRSASELPVHFCRCRFRKYKHPIYAIPLDNELANGLALNFQIQVSVSGRLAVRRNFLSVRCVPKALVPHYEMKVG